MSLRNMTIMMSLIESMEGRHMMIMMIIAIIIISIRNSLKPLHTTKPSSMNILSTLHSESISKTYLSRPISKISSNITDLKLEMEFWMWYWLKRMVNSLVKDRLFVRMFQLLKNLLNTRVKSFLEGKFILMLIGLTNAWQNLWPERKWIFRSMRISLSHSLRKSLKLKNQKKLLIKKNTLPKVRQLNKIKNNQNKLSLKLNLYRLNSPSLNNQKDKRRNLCGRSIMVKSQCSLKKLLSKTGWTVKDSRKTNISKIQKRQIQKIQTKDLLQLSLKVMFTRRLKDPCMRTKRFTFNY